MLHAQTLSTHTHLYTYTDSHVHAYTHTQTRTHVHTQTYTHMHAQFAHTYNCKHTHIYTHACMHAHTYKHTHINILRRCCLEDVATHMPKILKYQILLHNLLTPLMNKKVLIISPNQCLH